VICPGIRVYHFCWLIRHRPLAAAADEGCVRPVAVVCGRSFQCCHISARSERWAIKFRLLFTRRSRRAFTVLLLLLSARQILPPTRQYYAQRGVIFGSQLGHFSAWPRLRSNGDYAVIKRAGDLLPLLRRLCAAARQPLIFLATELSDDWTILCCCISNFPSRKLGET